ncbi:hypothetical protein FBU30_003992 [Linnemannia zychae]|nr:hypothetical protein FBU30_003992 [Linnemannia zychae]
MTSLLKQSSRFSFIKGLHKKDNLPKDIAPPSLHANPFLIPEVLERILSWLDEHTCKIACLVCRQWFYLIRTSRQVVFDGRRHTRTINKTFARISGAGSLWWRSDHDYWLKPPPQRVHWEFLKKTLQLVHERYQQQQRQLQIQEQDHGGRTITDNQLYLAKTRKRLYNPLRTLELIDNPRLSYFFSDILPYLSTLTDLRLYPATPESFDLNEILTGCPLLEVLHILAREKLRVFGPWDIMTKLKELQKEVLPGERHPKAQIPLRSLVLRNIIFHQSCIEEMLSYTPHLYELELIIWSPHGSTPFDPPQFYRRLRSLNHIHLKTFHVAFEGQFDDASIEFKEVAKKICPHQQQWLFWTGDLTPAMSRCLLEQQNVVTSLELVFNHFATCGPNGLLHKYLCASPHLLHLRAFATAYLFDHMDLHQRTLLYGGAISLDLLTNGQTYLAARPGVWACRGLKTLYLTFDGPTERQRFSQMWLRIMFGYLSRVVPRIEDIQIGILSCSSFGYERSKQPLHLPLQSGFCLLSRLAHLERLRIGCDGGSVECQRSDIEWMASSGQSPSKIEERRKIVAGWAARLAEEEKIEEMRSQRLSSMTMMNDSSNSHGGEGHSSKPMFNIWHNVEPELKKELENLGRLQDVKNAVDDMSKNGFRCWPLIQKVSFHRPIETGLTPERELKEMFPLTTLSGVRLRLGQRSYPVSVTN